MSFCIVRMVRTEACIAPGVGQKPFAKRPLLLNEICGGEYIWPKDKPFIAFQPPAPAIIPRWKARLVDLSIAAMLALISWAIYELVLR
jgi:hypothetical protein